MKIKSFFLKTLACAAMICSLNALGYSCGDAPSAANQENWCVCYYKYMIKSCLELGGGEQCTDAFLREITDELGGPSADCSMVPSPGMSQDQCVSTLSYYLASCSARA